jgi:2-haloacid dehalogenase
MVDAIAFDLYGTLFDTNSVAETCEKLYPGMGAQLSQLCREKQLQYTWLVSMMNKYADFESVTRSAIKFVLNQLNLRHNDDAVEKVYSAYLHLKPFPDVPDALRSLRRRKKLAILSNGTEGMIREVLNRSSLSSLFHKVISVDQAKTYKPSPRVYALAPRILKVPKAKILFVSSNPWDVSGAKAYGFKVAWVNRKVNAAFDELGYRPDHEVSDLSELIGVL